MRIAQASDSLMPLNSGLDKAVYEFAAYFGKKGHESFCIAPMPDMGYRALLPFEIIDFLPVKLPGLSNFRTGIAALDKHYLSRVDMLELDIIHAHSPGFSGLEAARLAEQRHIPLAGTYHGGYFDDLMSIPHSEPLITLAHKYAAEFYSRCDLCLTHHKKYSQELISFGFRGPITCLEDIIPEDIKDAKGYEKAASRLLLMYKELLALESFRLKRKRGLFRRELETFDKSLEKRKLMMMKSFLAQDYEHIYSYDYSRAHKLSYARSKPLQMEEPQGLGVSPLKLARFFQALDADIEARVQAMLITRKHKIISQGYWAPYRKNDPHLLFSMSKSVTSIAIGMLWDENKLSLDERLVDIFKEKVDNVDDHPMREVTVRHLLTMSTGARFDEIGTALSSDWVLEFLSGGVRFKAGSEFQYNSMNTYMLSAIVHKKAGRSMQSYLDEKLFAPLGIASASWETCPRGIEKGGWGLSLSLEDAAKLGLLFLADGMWGRKRILSREYVRLASSKQIDTPNGEMTSGYGFQIWMTPHEGAYLFNGAFGQYILILPEHEAVIALFCGSARLFAKGTILDEAIRCFDGISETAIQASPEQQRLLKNYLRGLSHIKNQSSPGILPMPMPWLAQDMKRSFSFEKNNCGIMPFVIQCLHNAFSRGITKISFVPRGKDIQINFVEGESSYTLYAAGEKFTYTTIKIREEEHPVAVSSLLGLSQEGKLVLRLYVYFLTTPSTRVIDFYFNENDIEVEFDEIPTANDASIMLLNLAGITRTELFRNLSPLLQGEKLKQKLREFSKTRATGHCIE